MPPRLTVMGNINMDFSIRTELMPAAGEIVTAEGVELIPGGKGANQAVAAVRLGAEVLLVGCLGHDVYGRALRQRMSQGGVGVKFVSQEEGVATGMAFLLRDASAGQPRVLSVPGANLALTPDRVEQAHRAFERADFFLTSLTLADETTNRALQIAADCFVPILLDPAPLPGKPPQLWTGAHLLTPNRAEASRLTRQTVTDLASAVEACRRMRTRGIERVALTLGAEGCLLSDEEGERLVPGFAVTLVDSTAAKDAFTAALGVRMAEEAGFEVAATFANAAAALACTVRGAQISLPTREAVEALLERTRRDKQPLVKAV